MAPSLPAGSATILSAPEGLAISTSGTGCVPGNYVTPFTLVWTPGSTCTLTTTSPQSSNGLSYTFNNWSDGTTALTDTVSAPSTSATYTATFSNPNSPARLVFSAPPATPIAAGRHGRQRAGPGADGRGQRRLHQQRVRHADRHGPGRHRPDLPLPTLLPALPASTLPVHPC